MKLCSKCGKEKDVKEFRLVKRRDKMVRHPYCNQCVKETNKIYNDRRLEKLRKGRTVQKSIDKKQKNYLSNRELTYEMIISREMGILSDKAKNMLLLINKNISRKFHYANPDDRLDCEAEGLYQMFKNWYSFDIEKGDNAFSFFTEVSKRGFAQGFNRLYKKDGNGGYWKPVAFSQLFKEDSDINI